jgi:hypothetical protein
LTADARLDDTERGDPAQGLDGDRRAGGLVELVELAPRGPNRRRTPRCGRGQSLEADIAIDLQDATERAEMGSGSLLRSALLWVQNQ